MIANQPQYNYYPYQSRQYIQLPANIQYSNLGTLPSLYNGTLPANDTYNSPTASNHAVIPVQIQPQPQKLQPNFIVQFPNIPQQPVQNSQNTQNTQMDMHWMNKISPLQDNSSQILMPNKPIIPEIQPYFTVKPLDLSKARKFKLDGNNARAKGDFKRAIELYNKALEIDPYYTDVLYNIGKTYTDTGELNMAADSFKRLLMVDPKDFETRTLLGEIYDNLGNLDLAMAEFVRVLEIEPKYDFAKRSYFSAYFKKMSKTNPQQAKEQSDKLSAYNLSQAIEQISLYGPQNISNILKTVKIQFGMTEEVNKYENMAQYENSNNRILISNKLKFADPKVTATYLVHEGIHAQDKDDITSVWEEQDAFEEMTKFWIKINNGLIDPDLTLAENLYKEHPEKLNSKVAMIYVKRDPNIRRTSPNHGETPAQDKYISSLYNALKSLVATQSLTENPNQSRNTEFDKFILSENLKNSQIQKATTTGVMKNSNLRLEEDR